jgi:hypothetical protein
MSMTTLQGVQSPAFASLQSMQAQTKAPPWLEAFTPRKGETPFNQFMNTLMNPKGTDAGAKSIAYGQIFKGLGEMMQGMGRLMNAKSDGQSNPGLQPNSGLGQILAAILAAATQALQSQQSPAGEGAGGNEGTARANGQLGKLAPTRTDARGATPPQATPARSEASPMMAASLPTGGPKGAEHSESRITKVTKETTTTTTVETNSDRATAAPGRAANAAA